MLVRKLILAATICVLAAFVTPATISAGAPGTAKFWVEKDSIDLGKVVAGNTATATFIFHNDGEAEVRIIRAAPS